MLTETDWNRFFAILDHFPAKNPLIDVADSYKVLLDGVSADTIMIGIRRLMHSDQKWRPTAPEILAATRRDPTVPTFDEALRLIFGSRGILNASPPSQGLWMGDSRRLAKDAAVMERLAAAHPLIATFVHRQGLQRLRGYNIDSFETGAGERRTDGWHRKELREAWKEHCEAQAGRETAVLAAGTGPRGLAQLDPLRALNVVDPHLLRLRRPMGRVAAPS